MFARLPTRRAIAASAVILFHLLLFYALIEVTKVPLGLSQAKETIITLFFRPDMEKPTAPPKHKPVIPMPPVSRTIYLPYLPPVPVVPPPVVPETNYNGLHALGRYLYNCSGAYYEQLSDREWAHCLANRWDIPAEKQPVPVLSVPKPSQFDIIITERKKPAVSVEHQCKLGEMNSNLGMPCYDFSGQ